MRIASLVVLIGASCMASACTASVSSFGAPEGNPGRSQDAADPAGPGDAGRGSGSGSGSSDRYFSQAMFYDADVSGVLKAPTSDAKLAALAAEGGWGDGEILIDFSIDVLAADASAPMRTFAPTGDFYAPDCDQVAMPVPVGGNLEGEDGYQCTQDGDCHLLVSQPSSHALYEMWRANMSTSDVFTGGCLAVWHTDQVYTDALRGMQCTSADAAGFPIAPLVFTADEVAAGEIDHAIRFVLPNNRVAPGFTHPATHATSTSGRADAPSYGVHLRLRADYPIDALPSAGAKVVARAMQRYGMYHADGGNIALTAQSDRHTAAKWSGLLDSHDLAALQISDFEVIDHGSTIALTDDCQR